MTALMEPSMASAPFLEAPLDPTPILKNPAPQYLNPFDVSRSGHYSSIPKFQEEKSRIETNLRPTRSYKPQKQPCRRPSKSTAYISRENLSPDRVKHLERNRAAANKCRLKKKQEHKEIQNHLDAETAKRKTLLAEIGVLKEEVWQLKNQMLQHAASCDDQDIYQQLAQMTRSKSVTSQAAIHCPSPSFSVSTMSDGSMESEGSRNEPSSFTNPPFIAPPENSENLIDSFINFPNV
ncbi:hypothetical protein N7532_011246 [Penicillium argentinense]|uniref:BZIP domain-containing protein n=1 Tax=Penicillium argentinense TaxID=1131581 RepID=A0A9W9EI26_9EURO|nr:uncharacterized protein N7532_011246 [Penicillium argentinense]KAJ5082203.1 hypothetical protein N7532_011246 [Penicillium argentinense]